MTNKSKRNLLKSVGRGSGLLLGGAAIPESWRKPMVKAVLLPAHAATTDAVDPPATTQAPAQCSHQLYASPSSSDILIESGRNDITRSDHVFVGVITPPVAGTSVTVSLFLDNVLLTAMPAVLTETDGSYNTNVSWNFGSGAFENVATVSATAVAQTGDECATANWTGNLFPAPTTTAEP